MKIIKGAVLLTLIILSSAYLTSGLELTASTGSNEGSSSTHVVYGATVDDYAHEHIGLNPGEAMLSNSFSGSGSLPSNSISKSDSKGNYVSVSRSVSGKSGTTIWKYDWNTYLPYSSTAGSGVGANLLLTANNAYSISGSGYASNKEGDIVNAYTSVGNSYPYTTSYLSNYQVNPYAFTNKVGANQKADYASSSGTSTINTYVSNLEGDVSQTNMAVTNGKISKPANNGLAGKSAVSTSLSMNAINAYDINGFSSAINKEGDFSVAQEYISSSKSISSLSAYDTSSDTRKESATAYQKAASGTGDYVWFNGYSGNKEGDRASSYITGSVNSYVGNPLNTVWARNNHAYAYESTSGAYGGNYANMLSHVENKAPASEGSTVYTGAGDFGVQKNKNNILSGSITSTADASMVYLTPKIDNVPFYRTAYILDPWRNQWTIDYKGTDQTTLIPKFMNDEFAVTYYRDSAVTRDRVYSMDDYWASLVSAHAGNDGFAITRDNGEMISAYDLKSQFTKGNGLTIFNGCSSFKPTSSGSRPLYDALNGNSYVAGGYEKDVVIGPPFGQSFIVKFFETMTDFSKPQSERTARAANDQAYAWVRSNNPGWVEDAYPKLKLLPSNHDLFVFV